MINLFNLICTDPLVSLTCGPGLVLHQLGPSLKSGRRMKFLINRGVKRSLTSYRLWESYGMRKATKRRYCFSARLSGFRRWQEAYVTWTGAEKWKQDKKWAQPAWVDKAGIIEINEHISFIFIIWIPRSVSFLILGKHTVLFIALNQT